MLDEARRQGVQKRVRRKRPNARVKARWRRELVARDGWLCCLCGKPIDLWLPRGHLDAATIHHKVAMRDGGTNELENLALAHRSCHGVYDNLKPGTKL